MYYDSGLTNILVTGARGQIGSALSKRLGPRAIPLDRRQLDIADCDMVEAVVKDKDPQAIINCAGFTNVRQCDGNTKYGWEANSMGVANLANVASRLAIPLIHVSSDFVFGQDKNKDTPYDEDDPTGPINNYGFSKLAGEFEILRHAAAYCDWPYAIVRTAGVFSMPGTAPKSSNFFRTIIPLSKVQKRLEVASDVHTNLTRAEDLAEALIWLLFFIEENPRGIYHITNPGCTTWYDAARLLIGDKAQPVSKETCADRTKTPCAVMPNYTCLGQRKYLELGGPELPPWNEAVKELAAAL